jgi:hypothetical protein
MNFAAESRKLYSEGDICRGYCTILWKEICVSEVLTVPIIRVMSNDHRPDEMK